MQLKFFDIIYKQNVWRVFLSSSHKANFEFCIISSFCPLSVFAKSTKIDVSLDSKYAFASSSSLLLLPLIIYVYSNFTSNE